MFGMDLHEIVPDHGELPCFSRQEAAVDCWFTSTGHMIPRSLKCREQDHILRIEPITILKEEENRYAGVLVHLFHCRAAFAQDTEREFSLLFYVEQCRWYLQAEG